MREIRLVDLCLCTTLIEVFDCQDEGMGAQMTQFDERNAGARGNIWTDWKGANGVRGYVDVPALGKFRLPANGCLVFPPWVLEACRQDPSLA